MSLTPIVKGKQVRLVYFIILATFKIVILIVISITRDHM